MSLNESIVEDAALIMPAATLTQALSHREREKRVPIRRLNPANPEEARATGKRYLQVRFEMSTP